MVSSASALARILSRYLAISASIASIADRCTTQYEPISREVAMLWEDTYIEETAAMTPAF
jgi:hypothetical protein